MGVDIYGWVEVYQRWGTRDQWSGVVAIDDFVDRSYNIFGSLFGVRGDDEFKPIAAGRGLPTDLSQKAFLDVKDGGEVAPTWILWSEITAINWEEEAQEAVGETSEGPPPRRKDGLTVGWNVLFDLMRVLANYYGDERVRLVVWFDQL